MDKSSLIYFVKRKQNNWCVSYLLLSRRVQVFWNSALACWWRQLDLQWFRPQNDSPSRWFAHNPEVSPALRMIRPHILWRKRNPSKYNGYKISQQNSLVMYAWHTHFWLCLSIYRKGGKWLTNTSYEHKERFVRNIINRIYKWLKEKFHL